MSVLHEKLNFPTMTPVQATAIPPILNCKDVCVEAETGSGKTLSFLLPIAQSLLFSKNPAAVPRNSVRAIVLLPTRELALQVHTVASTLFSHLPGAVVPVPLIGGSACADGTPGPDARFARDTRVLVATPGRLSAALRAGVLFCAELEMLIMDEADRLLDMGFSVAVSDILARLPKQRRTGMYSATQTDEVDALARAGMRNPVRILVRARAAPDERAVAGPSAPCEPAAPAPISRRARIPAAVRCTFAVVSPRDKLASVMQALAARPHAKAIIYVLTCACVEFFRRLPLSEMLGTVERARTAKFSRGDECDAKGADERKDGGENGREDEDDEDEEYNEHKGEDAERRARAFFPLHGKMTQSRRERNLAQFAACEAGVLLCTDVAARGIDIADVDVVIQFDLPQDPDAYIHRAGRTGRLGRKGEAITLLSEWEEAYIEFLRLRKCPISKTPDEEARPDDTVRDVVGKGVREAILGDRALLEASESAFLSFVRAYKEHKCGYLLKVEEVDFNSVGDAFGLLRLPRFHEFKKVRDKIERRNKEGISVRDIEFKDKNREKRRQEDIKEAIANRAQRREALQAKSKKRKKKKKGSDAGKSAGQKDGRQGKEYAGDDEDEDDFSMEAMQLRKLKRRKMSVADFDKAAGYDRILDDEE